jgi:transitional endoplasmic reticulum ATPase
MSKGSLIKGFKIKENYEVLLNVKVNSTAETYRVRGKDKRIYLLKLFKPTKLKRSAFNEDGELLEINFLKSFDHPNVLKYQDSGDLIIEGKKYPFLILQFIPGETLSERIVREPFNSIYDIKLIANGVLEGLKYIHSLEVPIIHNELTPQNIMLDLSGNIPTPKIIDFGFARSFHQSAKSYNKDGLNINHIASECFNSIYSPQSDIYSVGVLIYQLIYGLPPWFRDISKIDTERNKIEDLIVKERSKPLDFKDVSDRFVDFNDDIIPIIRMALEEDPDDRFQSAEDFIKVLNGEIDIQDLQTSKKVKSKNDQESKIKKLRPSGKGFDAIAGMQELKNQLKIDVIDALHNPEEYAKYGVTLPNGMLLYGPPGCGKTFFAKHFAEEVGFNFMFVTPSTLKSRYVNATQENIAKMFEEAEKNAPTIIFIDEINELLPNRDSDAHEMSKSAVNEMLAHMDRTGDKGIFIIGATNYPDLIDPAILRAGRLEKKFYLSPPDLSARAALFEMYLKGRPLDFGLDYIKLAEITENYVSADIEYLVNEASRHAMVSKSRITMEVLKHTIEKSSPSVPLKELKKYELIRASLNSENSEKTEKDSERKRIGFK